MVGAAFKPTILCNMRIFPQTLILLCLLPACAAPVVSPAFTPTLIPVQAPFAARDTLTGEWLGGFTKSDGSVFSLIISFTDTGGNLNIQPFTKSWSLSDFVQAENNITFNIIGKSPDLFEQIHFEGELSNSGLTGDLNWDDDSYPVEFSALTQIDARLLEKYVGVYRFDSGRTVSVLLCPSYDDGKLQYFPPGLMFTDLTSGDSRGLYPLEDSTFGLGSARVLAYPLEENRIQFILNDSGEVTGLQSIDSSDPAKIEIASPINYSVEDVTFTSADGAVMAGLLTSPETSEPHSAFMMLHGSEPGVKDGFGQQILAHYMISQGIALLTYDKRGVGNSEGGYSESANESNINLIASDAVAGADYLSARPEIDSTKIGLIGGSQAGWVIPVAAAQSDKVDFFVIFSGPVLSFAHEDRYSSVTNDGDSATTYDAEKLDQTLREMKPSGVDPIPVLAELTQPGLWLWGSVDKNVPSTVSAENLQTLIDSDKTNFSYTILPNGDHNLNESAHGYFAEIPYSPRVLYFSKLTEWLEQNNLTKKE